ncbi:MAG: HAD-IC family P-type ATPase [Patescibacteria group bacterium]
MQLTKDILRRSFWALPIREVLDALETTKFGLADDEVEARRQVFNKNILPKSKGSTGLKIFLRQFKSPLLLLLLAASGITLFLEDYRDTIAILAAVAVNVILGFYQENKAEAALANLKTYIVERTRVLRNGQEIELESADLVPGDIVHLSQGDRVPADSRLIYINDFFVDESILTGESLPVIKTTEPSSFKAVLADRRSMVFSGTSIIQGFANAVVCATGSDTELGKIAGFVAAAEKETTPLQRSIFNFSLKVSIFLTILTAAIFFFGIYLGHPILDMFLIAVAVAVSAVPEGLPVAMTVILAIGVQRLAKRNGVVRKLIAAETLGNTSIILTDKTGTLTEAKMTLSEISVFTEEFSRAEILKNALFNTDVVIENPRDPHDKWRIIGRPLEIAIAKEAAREGISFHGIKKESEQIDFLPFTSKNKFSASIIKTGERYLLNVLGAPEILIKLSNLKEEERHQLVREVDKMAYSGERVLGLAVRELTAIDGVSLRHKSTFENLKFLGTFSFRDPIRQGVKEALATVERAGVKTVIVTGDHKGTAEAVAKELGMHIDRDEVIDGFELDLLSDEALKKKLPFLRIVSRVSPEGKLRIAKTFQSLGETIAMTGDGINDAGSLKQADIGIAMGSGTDVAKDVSDLVLLDDNFSTIVSAIEEGRRIIENIRKVIVYLFSSIFSELFLIGGALLIGIALPLNALQILFVNFIADSFPAVSLAFEDHIDYLARPKRKISRNLFDKEMAFLTFVVGLPSSLFLFLLYYYLLSLGFDAALVKTFIFASFGSYSLFLIFSVRSLRKPIIGYNFFSNPVLLIGVLAGLGSIMGTIYWEPAQSLLSTVSLPLSWLIGVIGFGLVNLIAIEIGKWLIRPLPPPIQ